jgi:hypothetical protein
MVYIAGESKKYAKKKRNVFQKLARRACAQGIASMPSTERLRLS